MQMIISVVNSKGGVGKTTLSAALAVRAAQDYKRVCMVDLDPQRSLVNWWKRRGSPHGENEPVILEGVDSAEDAAERIAMTGWDVCFLDGPPAFLMKIQEMVEVSDFVLIPVKPSMLDVLATQDAVVLTREAGTEFMCVINDAGENEKRLIKSTKQTLFNANVPIAEAEIFHRKEHIIGMGIGKSAAEVGNDAAASEIDRLWKELKAAAQKAAKAKSKKAKVANVG